MTPTETAWLAAIVEGEGCCDAPRGNPRLRVKMTDLDVILRVATIMGAKYHVDTWSQRVRGHRPLWVASITGPRAVTIMREILPFMGTRRTAKMADIIAAHDLKKKRT